MHKQMHKIMRSENHYVHCLKLSQKATKTGSRLAKGQCETCQRLLDRIFGDEKLSKYTSQTECNNSEIVRTPKTAQFIAQIQAIPSKIYKYRKLITKSFGGVVDNQKVDFKTKDTSSPNLQNDKIYSSHVIPEEIETKEVIQLVNQNRRLQKSSLVKRIDRRNKPKIIKRERIISNRIQQVTKPQEFPTSITPLTPTFEPLLIDKPLFKIIEKHNIYHNSFCRETILLEHKEYVIPTKYDKYYIDKIESLPANRIDQIETPVNTNPENNCYYEQNFEEVNKLQDLSVIPLTPIFEPHLPDKLLSQIVDKNHFDYNFFCKETILLEHKECVIPTKCDEYYINKIENLSKENIMIANEVDQLEILAKTNPVKMGSNKEYEHQAFEHQQPSSTPLTPIFEHHLTDKLLLKVVDKDNIDHDAFCKETIVLEHKEYVIPTKDDKCYTNKIESLHMENVVVANVVDQKVLNFQSTSFHKEIDRIDDIFKSDSVVKQAMETKVNTNVAPNCLSKDTSQRKKKVSLEALLKEVREENRNKCTGKKMDRCKNNKKPPCPPPPPACPPNPPKPPCPMPCPKPSPKPTKCPAIPTDCPPPPKKCFHNVNDSSTTLLIDSSSELNHDKFNGTLQRNKENLNVSNVGSENSLVKTIIEDILNGMTLKTLNVNICLLRSFEPWTPIPSWPIPKEAPKIICPKQSKYSKPTTTQSRDPCKTDTCTGYPKKKTYT